METAPTAKKMKIVSDGTVQGTKVLDVEGKEVQGVTMVSWVADAKNKVVVAMVTLHDVELEVTNTDTYFLRETPKKSD